MKIEKGLFGRGREPSGVTGRKSVMEQKWSKSMISIYEDVIMEHVILWISQTLVEIITAPNLEPAGTMLSSGCIKATTCERWENRTVGDGKTSPLVKCLLHSMVSESRSPIFTEKAYMVACTPNPRAGQAEAEGHLIGSLVQSLSSTFSEGLCLKK